MESDWRERLGLDIDEDLMEETSRISSEGLEGSDHDSAEDELEDDGQFEEYVEFGTTPPRTRVFKNRKWKDNKTYQKEIAIASTSRHSSQLIHKRTSFQTTKQQNENILKRKMSLRGTKIVSLDQGEESGKSMIMYIDWGF
ncbi:unnamed protein product [Lepeophtheirus salmonis]|uniref:(salmon louse) hypothetical protein n=1 Tax=Lepeophtheirus salmonis TaxID=72036 RepID=A0A7R8H0N3_LEPSM|nr:unnamed protein product [Lepeophtheirus salmonis]CAF2792840.1 unnamed protein product [Lepeophtheirus salmonis]